jgi:hypothetical protein
VRDYPPPVRGAAGSALAALTIAAAIFAAAATTAAAQHDAGVDQDALTQLAERYAPIVMLQHQAEPCGSGEAFAPEPVGQVLAQPDVVLRDSDGNVLMTAPSADDLAAAPAGSNLDFPGNAADPGCDFEQRFGRRTSTLPATQYVRLGIDPERPGYFAIQYWWWYVYNDWNDLHEGDWEMSQIVFDASTPQEALDRDLAPSRMALSQHFGTEIHDWADVHREGDRPLVFSAAGSHAGYYSAHRWFGTDGDAGFGCDDTRGPSDRIDPRVVMMPVQPTPGDGFGWMEFRGSWGQREPALNDSETGPQTSTQWLQPIRWMEDSGRSAAVRVPQVGGVTAFFCVAAAKGSDILNALLHRPLIAGGLIAGLAAVIVVLARRTRWRPVLASPVVAPRAAGQILWSAWSRLRVERHRFLPVAAFVVAGAIASTALQWLLVRLSPLSTTVDVVGRNTPLGQLLAVLTGLAITVPVAIVALAWSVNVADHDVDAPTGTDGGRVRRSGVVLSCAVIILTVLLGWIILPLGALLLARWFVAPAAAAHDHREAREALRLSATLTRGRRMRTLLIAAVTVAVAFISGLLLGVVALILTNASFTFVNALAGLIGAVLLPWMGIVVSMTWGDLSACEGRTNASSARLPPARG